MLTNYFKDILDNYLESKTTGRFNKNHEMFKLINYTTTDALNEIVKEYGLGARVPVVLGRGQDTHGLLHIMKRLLLLFKEVYI